MSYDPELAQRRRAEREAMRQRWPEHFDQAQQQAPDPDPELARDVQQLIGKGAGR